MKKELVLVKLGGSIITNKKKAFSTRKKVISDLAGEIKSALKEYKGDLIIGHGSGSFGHSVAAKYQTQLGIVNKKSLEGFPLVSYAAREINRIVVEIFLKEGLKAVSFSPLSFIYAKNEEELESLSRHIQKSLEIGLLPVIYGDVIMDEEKGFCIYSGEKSLNLLAGKLYENYKKVRIVYCGETQGVYDGKGKTIERITPESFVKVKKAILGSKEVDVTGGMLHKVLESLEIAEKLNLETVIINGLIKGSLKKGILGEKTSGTVICC